MSDEGKRVNLAALRALLLSAFQAEELRRFCQEQPAFEPILANLGPGYNLNQMVDEVIGYCQTHLLFDRLLAGVRAADPRQVARFEADLGLPAAALEEGDCPYRGLEPFEAEHAEFYFGREAMVEQLVDKLEDTAFVAVVGSSGCGKSSLVRAGLVTALRSGMLPGSRYWEARIFRPGADPLYALSAALVELLEPEESEVDRLADARKLATHLQQGTLLMADVAGRLGEAGLVPHLVLIVDQFEELYTECQEEALQRAFLEVLLAAAAEDDITVVLTLRADFYGRVLDDPLLGEPVNAGLVNVLPMNEPELWAAIEQPALRTGRLFEPGLVARIVDDVAGQPGDLPLLEFALTELWVRQTPQGVLTHEAYELIGGVKGAIAGRAETVYGELARQGHADVVRRIFVRLTHYGTSTEGMRRQALVEDLVTPRTPREAVEPVLKALADARLLVTGRKERQTATAEVSHEALIRSWARLQGWLGEDQAFSLWRQKLATARRMWVEAKQDEGALLRGAPLAEAEGWLTDRGEELNKAEHGFVEESLALRVREEAEREVQRQREAEAKAEQERKAAELAVERQATGRLRRLALALAIAVVIGLVLAVFATVQLNRATQAGRARETEVAVRSTAEAEAISARDAESTEVANRTTAEAEAIVERDARATEAAIRATAEADALYQRDGANQAQGTAYAALATAHVEATARVAAQAEAEEQRDRAEALYRIARSRELAAQAMARARYQSDVALLLSLEALRFSDTVEARSALLTALRARVPLYRELGRHPNGALSVALSPDGQRLASAGCDGPVFGCTQGDVRLWDVAGGQALGEPLVGHGDTVFSVVFDPVDGQTLASGSWDHTVILWDVATGTSRGQPLLGHFGSVLAVDYSPDGKALASGSEDGYILLWDVGTGRQTGRLVEDYPAGVMTLAFSPDGEFLASGTAVGSVLLWDVTTGQPGVSLPAGYGAEVFDVAFSPDGQTLAAGVMDGDVFMWDVAAVAASGTEEYQGPTVRLEGHTDRVMSIAFSPDNDILASGSCGLYDEDNYCVEGEVRLWDVATGQLLGEPLGGHEGRISSLAFSPGGQTLVSGSWDGSILLWEVGLAVWTTRACELVTRELSEQEWQQYLPDRERQDTCPYRPADG